MGAAESGNPIDASTANEATPLAVARDGQRRRTPGPPLLHSLGRRVIEICYHHHCRFVLHSFSARAGCLLVDKDDKIRASQTQLSPGRMDGWARVHLLHWYTGGFSHDGKEESARFQCPVRASQTHTKGTLGCYIRVAIRKQRLKEAIVIHRGLGSYCTTTTSVAADIIDVGMCIARLTVTSVMTSAVATTMTRLMECCKERRNECCNEDHVGNNRLTGYYQEQSSTQTDTPILDVETSRYKRLQS